MQNGGGGGRNGEGATKRSVIMIGGIIARDLPAKIPWRLCIRCQDDVEVSGTCEVAPAEFAYVTGMAYS